MWSSGCKIRYNPAWDQSGSRRGSRRGAVRAVLARGSDALHTRASAPAPACSVLVLCDAHQRKTAAEQARGGPAPSPSAATARGGSALGVRAKPVPRTGTAPSTPRAASPRASPPSTPWQKIPDLTRGANTGTRARATRPTRSMSSRGDHPAWGARGSWPPPYFLASPSAPLFSEAGSEAWCAWRRRFSKGLRLVG